MIKFSRILRVTDSGPISEIAYDFKSQTLKVCFFRTKSTWYYYNVPPSVFGRLAGAYSVGATFNDYVRDRYDAGKSIEKKETDT